MNVQRTITGDEFHPINSNGIEIDGT